MAPKPTKASVVTTSKKDKDKDKFPVSKVDYTQPLIVKNSKVSFGEKLETAKIQHKDRLEDLIFEMDAVKRENERLRRQQEDTFGITVDTVDRMKKELERARTTRMFLLEDIQVRKAKSEKMEADIFELNMKLESFSKKIHEFNKMKEEWVETSDKLQKTEGKCEKLAKVNKNLRLLMVKHHIDPKSVDFDNSRSKKSQKSEKGPLRPILKPMVKQKKPDAHMQAHTNASSQDNNKSKSMGDIREALYPVNDDIRRRTAITSRKALGRGPPSYLGYYSDIHHNRVLGKPGYLPKLVVA